LQTGVETQHSNDIDNHATSYKQKQGSLKSTTVYTTFELRPNDNTNVKQIQKQKNTSWPR